MRIRRLLFGTSVVAVITLLIVLALSNAAPENSEVLLSEPICIENENNLCLAFPTITGTNLSGDGLTLPADFTGDYVLVVVPFDRDQQVRADTWLPFAVELAENYEGFNYYDVPVFPELSAPVRLFARTGLIAIITDHALRQRTVTVFLEEREAFLRALEIPDVEQIQLFLLDDEAQVLWRGVGSYTEDQGNALSEILAESISARGAGS